jgi:hypothetical protein
MSHEISVWLLEHAPLCGAAGVITLIVPFLFWQATTLCACALPNVPKTHNTAMTPTARHVPKDFRVHFET